MQLRCPPIMLSLKNKAFSWTLALKWKSITKNTLNMIFMLLATTMEGSVEVTILHMPRMMVNGLNSMTAQWGKLLRMGSKELEPTYCFIVGKVEFNSNDVEYELKLNHLNLFITNSLKRKSPTTYFSVLFPKKIFNQQKWGENCLLNCSFIFSRIFHFLASIKFV